MVGVWSRLQSAFAPYARLARWDKPIGTYLLLYPTLWGVALATPPGTLPSPALLGLFAVGAFSMRGAGCVINDMWDRDLDRQVERTRSRPLASGEVSMKQAALFCGSQMAAGALVLLQLPPTSIYLGLGSLPLVAAYPLMKRVTHFPQAVLGLAFNWGVLVGYAATAHMGIDNVLDGLLHHALPLYASGIAWTLYYDTIYAHQDKLDDEKAGIKSTARFFSGSWEKPALVGFATATASLMTIAGLVNGLGSIFYTSVAGCWAAMLLQTRNVDLSNPAACGRAFRANQWIGLAVFLALVVDRYVQEPEQTDTKQQQQQHPSPSLQS